MIKRVNFIWFILLCGVSPLCALPPTLETPDKPLIRCDQVNDSAQAELQVHTTQTPSQYMPLVEFTFPRVGWLDPLDSCRAWAVQTLKDDAVDWKSARVVQLLASSREEARLSLKDAAAIYPLCSASDRCRLKAPYKWHWSLWGGALTKRRKTLPSFCYEKPIRYLESSLPSADTLTQVYPHLGFVSSWFEPESNFASEIIKMTKNIRNETVVISTMQWSFSQLKRLKEHFAEKRIKAYVIGDLQVWLSSRARLASQLFELSDDNFLILPAFSTPSYPNSHHIKGAIVANSEGDFLFSSTNLTSGDESTLNEFGIHGRSQDFASDWFSVVRDLVAEYCVERRRLACVLPQYLFDNDLSNLEVEETLSKACRAFYSDAKLEQIGAGRETKSKMIWAGRQSVPRTIQDLITNAKKSIEGTVHLVSHPRVISAIGRKKGIPVEIFRVGGAPGDLKNFSRPPASSPHVKAFLVDNDKLFWGTGNFTKTGLTNQRELFFITTDQKVIHEYRRYLTRVKEPGTRENLPGIRRILTVGE